jgi:hypothetical protein
MTTYPVEFHRRSEQKWALRALTATARESNESVIASAGSAGRADPTLAKRPEPNAVAAGNRSMATGWLRYARRSPPGTSRRASERA